MEQLLLEQMGVMTLILELLFVAVITGKPSMVVNNQYEHFMRESKKQTDIVHIYFIVGTMY